MKLKISLKTELFALRELITVTMIYFALASYLFITFDIELFNIIFLSTLSLYLLAFFLPTVILHVNYLNKSIRQAYLEEGKLFINNTIYTADDIESFTVFATAQYFSGTTGAYSLPYSDSYYRIELKVMGGMVLNLTSLLNHKIDELVKKNFKNSTVHEETTGFFDLMIK